MYTPLMTPCPSPSSQKKIKIHYEYMYKGQEKSIVFYMKLETVTPFEEIKTKIEKYLFKEGDFIENALRFYWLDADGDEIEIINDDDVQCYWDNEFNNTDLWIKPRNFPNNRNNNNNNNNNNNCNNNNNNNNNCNNNNNNCNNNNNNNNNCNNNNNNNNNGRNTKKNNMYEWYPTESVTHVGVMCDNCSMCPIVGFRYKCIECADYDICENCEHHHTHSDHMMIRIPNTNCAGRLDSLLIAGSYSGRNKCPTRNEKIRREVLSNIHKKIQDFAEGDAATSSSKNCYNNINHNMTTNAFNAATNLHEIAIKVARETANLAQRQILEAAQLATTAAAAGAFNLLPVNNSSMEGDMRTQKQSSNKNPQQSASTEEGTSASTTENKSGNNESSVKSSAISTEPLLPLETLLDPKFMKTGQNVLNEFTDMFAKMLDPTEESVTEPHTTQKDCTLPTSSSGEALRSTTCSDSSIEVLNISTSKENLNASETVINDKHNEYQLEDINDPEESDSSSVSESFIKLDVPNNETSTTTTKTVAKEKNTENNENISNVELSNDKGSAQPKPYGADFIELGTTLKAHANEESNGRNNNKNKASDAGIGASKSGASTAAPTNKERNTVMGVTQEEMRAVIVYHPDPTINTAIHQMMLMGFSNENGALTQLVESVNGNVSAALDLISAAQ